MSSGVGVGEGGVGIVGSSIGPGMGIGVPVIVGVVTLRSIFGVGRSGRRGSVVVGVSMGVRSTGFFSAGGGGGTSLGIA